MFGGLRYSYPGAHGELDDTCLDVGVGLYIGKIFIMIAPKVLQRSDIIHSWKMTSYCSPRLYLCIVQILFGHDGSI